MEGYAASELDGDGDWHGHGDGDGAAGGALQWRLIVAVTARERHFTVVFTVAAVGEAKCGSLLCSSVASTGELGGSSAKNKPKKKTCLLATLEPLPSAQLCPALL